ncbi:MAG: hypothetical protein HUJ65_07965, partial [Oscillospiraceae bacterium]|nr:hypothetical protein [Oscillospiraceae bacterium]
MKAYDDYFAEIINTMERDYALGSVSASEERNIRYSNALLTGAALRELDERMMAQIFSAYIEAFADRNAYIRAPGYISERTVHAVRKDDRLFVLR